jgi:hexosaminidase
VHRPGPRAGLGARIAALVLAAALAAPAALAQIPAPGAATANVLPEPASVQTLAGPPVGIGDGAVIAAPRGASARRTAAWLADLTARTRGVTLKVASPTATRSATIVFRRLAASGAGPEAYSLDVGRGRVVVSSATDAGLFYGAVTLWQLMTPDDGRGRVMLRPMHIDDAPRFAWRGLMLDSARHYQSPQFIERLIDVMALHKLNVLHWHLTDDQAWRLEIKKYPRLTSVGGWRTPAGQAGQADIDPATGKPRLYGGIYTQAQAREIVAYAAARNITVVPEVEMPGHALSAILAYPALGSDGPAPASIQSDYGVFPWLFNPDEKTFGVLEDVLTEVMAVFPSPFIHVGGDEAVKDQWKASPAVQARMKALGVADEDALQSYFTHRIGAFLTAHGRRLIGWDEILQGGPLSPSATVMSWRGMDGALTAARAGHDTVLSPAPFLYLDNRQSARPEEPSGRGFVINLRMVYDFNPAPASLTADQRKHILGLQGNLWTEHVRTEDYVEAMAFPREAAIAETGWSTQERHDWTSFEHRLPAMFDRYHALGFKADDAALAVQVEQQPGPSAKQATVSLSSQTGFGDIRYTTDGSDPTPASALYGGPLALPLPAHLKAAAFVDGRAVSAVADKTIDELSVRRRTSQQLQSCAAKLTLNLEDDGPLDGPRAKFLVDVMDPCWIYPKADLAGISSLSVSVGQLPFNFQLGKDISNVVLHPPSTPDGELVVRLDSCAGEIVATLPLTPAVKNTGVTTLEAALTQHAGVHDLCFYFTQATIAPMWAVDWVQLTLAPPPATSAGPGAKPGA